ncbi:MAG TPA: hypothetical protein VHH11_11460 [Gammaproteobacteria bacterium]|nr:hypothetical protein [Gammaproteobacteria bacterium]
MRVATPSAAAFVLLAAVPLHAQPPPAPPPPACTPGPSVVCNQEAPEDLMTLNPDWVLASSYAAAGDGGVLLVRTRDRVSFKAYPGPNGRDRPDRKTYPDCPGPPTGKFQTHGVYVEPGNGPKYRVFAVGHGAREAIEVFEVDVGSGTPTGTWIGCVVAPDPIGLNSVRGLPDGGFITTNFLPRGGTPEATQKMMGGAHNGELWEWHTASGWQKIPGSETAGANGVELSADGKTLYVAAWGSQSFFRLTRGASPPKRDEIPLGFRIDNIHWARDGSLWGTGQTEKGWKAVKIDPQTLAVRDIVAQQDTTDFNAGTAVAEVGNTLWVGSFRGNRIVIIPAPAGR